MAAKKNTQLKEVWTKITSEGFLEAFQNNDFAEVDNKTFHRLRVAYLKATERLEHYILKRVPNENQ